MNQPFACLYLHGFLSSPQSRKAQQLKEYFQGLPHAQLSIPTLPFAPQEAIRLAEETLLKLQRDYAKVLLIGSSLGGYYATYLAQKHHCQAVLINPAVRPFELLHKYLGPQQHFYDGCTYELTAHHIEQLQALDCPAITQPELFFLLLQTADETLDYRQASTLYQPCTSWLEGGGNHSFEHFIERMPMLLQWFLPAQP